MSQSTDRAKSSSEVPGGAGAGRRPRRVRRRGRPRVGAEEAHVGADPVQALQRLAHPDLGDVPGAVEEERVPAEPLAGGAGLDPGQVHPAYGQLGQHREQGADPVVRDVDRQRGDVVAGRRRRRAGPARPARTGSSRPCGRRSRSASSASWCRCAPIGAQIAGVVLAAGRAGRGGPVGQRVDHDRVRQRGRAASPGTGGPRCGWAATAVTESSVVPGRAASTKSTASTTSRVMTSGGDPASSSRVTPSAPPIEFSSGTRAASASPVRTASSASGTLPARRHGGPAPAAAAYAAPARRRSLGPEVDEPLVGDGTPAYGPTGHGRGRRGHPVTGRGQRGQRLLEPDRRHQHVVGVVGGEGEDVDPGLGQRVDQRGQDAGQGEVDRSVDPQAAPGRVDDAVGRGLLGRCR